MNSRALLLGLLVIFVLNLSANAQQKQLVVADFDSGKKPTNLGEDFGTWDGFPDDPNQSCKMRFVDDDALGKDGGKSIQLDYDVDSPNPAYNGFWMKISRAEVAGFDTFNFYIKGDPVKGFTKKIKVELKDKRGKAAFMVDNITDKWQRVTLKLNHGTEEKDQKRPFEEFVLVFDDINSRPKTGRLFIDQVEFSKSQ